MKNPSTKRKQMAREDLPITNVQVVQTRLHLARSFKLILLRLNTRSVSSRGRLDHEQDFIRARKRKLNSQTQNLVGASFSYQQSMLFTN